MKRHAEQGPLPEVKHCAQQLSVVMSVGMHWSKLLWGLVRSCRWISSSREQMSAWKIRRSQAQLLGLSVGVTGLNLRTCHVQKVKLDCGPPLGWSEFEAKVTQS